MPMGENMQVFKRVELLPYSITRLKTKSLIESDKDINGMVDNLPRWSPVISASDINALPTLDRADLYNQ